MAGKTIASGSAILTANADGLKTGLDKAQHDLKAFGAKANSAVAPPSQGGVASRLLGGLAGGLKAGVIGVAAGTAAAFGAEFLNATDRLETFDKLSKRAKSIGVSGSQFQGLTKQFEKFGMEAGDVSLVLEKFGSKMVDVAQGSAPQAEAELKKLGLSADELAKLPLDQQFLRTADAIAAMKSPSEQAHAAMTLFGKKGADLLPILQKGGVGIQDFIEEQKKLGNVLGDTQFDAAAKAGGAWKKAKETVKVAWEGLMNQAAIVAAPFIEKIGAFASNVLKFLRPVIDWFQRLWNQEGVLVVAVLEEIGKVIEEVVNWVQEAVAEVSTFSGEWPSVQEVVVKVFRTIGTVGAYMFDTLKAGAGVFAVGLGTVIQLLGDLADKFKGALKGIANLGADAAHALGLDDTEKMFQRLSDSVDRLGDSLRGGGKAMEDWGKDAVEALKEGRSSKKFNSWLDNLLAPKDAAAAGEEVGKKFAAGMEEGMGGKLEAMKFSAALHKGTKESYSAVIANQFSDHATAGKEHMKDIAKHTKRTADHGKGAEKRLRGIEEKLKEIEGF